jgi:hypothetical protein
MRDRDWIDRAIANGKSVAEVRGYFGEHAFPRRAKLVAELRSEAEMDLRTLEKRRLYVNAVLTMHSRLNSHQFG